jgi:hypothetical protein
MRPILLNGLANSLAMRFFVLPRELFRRFQLSTKRLWSRPVKARLSAMFVRAEAAAILTRSGGPVARHLPLISLSIQMGF